MRDFFNKIHHSHFFDFLGEDKQEKDEMKERATLPMNRNLSDKVG